MTDVDFLIIGSGAAGLSAALYGARSGLDTCVLDESVSGGQAVQIDSLENYPGVFPAVSGTVLSNSMRTQAEAFGARFVQAAVSSIDKKGDFFYIKTSREDFRAYSVLVASGAEHKTLGVEGEREFFGRGVSYCAVCDGPFFRGKTVVVVGGGDSACTESLFLSKLASRVILVHRRAEFRAQKVSVDRVMSAPNIQVRLNTVVKKIIGGDAGKNGGGVSGVILSAPDGSAEETVSADGVFIFAGMKPRTQLIDFLKKDSGGYIVTDESMATAVPGLFCAGDIRSKPLRQIVTACSDGAVAAFSAEKYIDSLKRGESK